MSATDVVLVTATVLACVAALAGLLAAVAMAGQVRRLGDLLDLLRRELLEVAGQTRELVGHATGEMAKVEAVLEDTESVTAAVDTAARAAQRAFANPVVKVLAYRAGAAGALRRLRQPSAAPPPGHREPPRTSSNGGSGR